MEKEVEKRILSQETAEELDTVFDKKETKAKEKVEAALFIAAKFMTLQELIVLTDVNPIMVKELLHSLEKKYSYGALRLIHRGNSWKMDIAPEYHYMINRLATGAEEFSKAEQETLAVIAYKQPIKQSVVIKIRGNKAYDHIGKFRETGLVSSKKEGHTKILTLSDDFYEYFNVHNKDNTSIEENSEGAQTTSDSESFEQNEQ